MDLNLAMLQPGIEEVAIADSHDFITGRSAVNLQVHYSPVLGRRVLKFVETGNQDQETISTPYTFSGVSLWIRNASSIPIAPQESSRKVALGTDFGPITAPGLLFSSM